MIGRRFPGLAWFLFLGCQSVVSDQGPTLIKAIHVLDTNLRIFSADSVEWIVERPGGREEFLGLLNQNSKDSIALCNTLIELGSPYEFAASEWLREAHPKLWDSIPKPELARIYVTRFGTAISDDSWMHLALGDRKELFAIHPAGVRLVATGMQAIRWLTFKFQDHTRISSTNNILNNMYEIRRCDLAAAFVLKILGRNPTDLAPDAPARDRQIAKLSQEIRRNAEIWTPDELRQFASEDK
jgi:hypothetical protein